MKDKYKNLEKDINERMEYYNGKNQLVSILRLINFIVIIFLLCRINDGYIYLYGLIIFIISFIVLVILHNNYYKMLDYYQRYLDILKEYDLRINNKWDCLSNTGEEFVNDDNLYLQDLDVIGKHSLYQYLCSAKTKKGKLLLYKNLDNIYLSDKELRVRQSVIEELVKKIDFVLNFQVILSKINNDADISVKISKEMKSNNYHFGLFILGNLITFVVLLLVFMGILEAKFLYLIIILKYCVSYLYQLIFRKTLEDINKVSRNAKNILELANYISSCEFENEFLIKIQGNAKKAKDLIKELDSINSYTTLYDNFIANFIFNGFLTMTPYIIYKFNKISDKDIRIIEKTINDIAMLECLISLANIGICRNDVVMPVRIKETELEFCNLAHPLLDGNKYVKNSFKKKVNVNIITGSNMSGKTSFLRTIGINLILSSAGTYVNATEFKSSYLKIFTSMRVRDDIGKNISTFYGELLRIKEALDYLDKDMQIIVLIDEIFKGTNYKDRIFGALNVIKKLNRDNVVTFLTTHDIEICDIKNVCNYHFREYYEDEFIKFDYKIREGKCETTNAEYLMRKLDIIE